MKRKTRKKIDLLAMSDVEKVKFIRQIRMTLQQKAVEAKLWRSFAETDNLTINGRSISCGDINLKGISFTDLLKAS